jgi:hypothetical protein
MLSEKAKFRNNNDEGLEMNRSGKLMLWTVGSSDVEIGCLNFLRIFSIPMGN